MKLIKKIFKFIDKKIIIPITKLFVLIGDKIKLTDKPLEKALAKKSGMIILSLVFAIVIFLIVDSKNISLIETNAEVIKNRPLTAIYNDEEYVIEGLPKTVDITLIGTKANLYLAKQLPTKDITVDLSDLKPGTHEVKLKYKQSLSSVEYKLDPSVVNVTVSIKQSETRQLTEEIVNINKLNTKLSVKDVELLYENTSNDKNNSTEENLDKINEVIIKGTNAKINKVSMIKALVDVTKIVDPKEGSNTVSEVPLVAYDVNGNKVDIEIVPSTITAKVNIESPSKEVPIEVQTTGNVIFGKAIKSITTSVQKVTIYGDSETLDKTNSIKVKVDINDLKSNKDYTLSIKKPSGIREISEPTVNVKIELDDESSTEISGVRLSYINLDSNYTAQITEQSKQTISVILKGVDSVITNIDATEVEAYVDLKGLGVGEHKVQINVTGNDSKVTYEPKVTDVIIKIAEK